jgi:hypothetical protein
MPTAYVAKRDSVVCEKFDDEAVLINFETGTYFSLRGAAPEIWTLIQSANTVDRIAERLCAEGSGARDEIRLRWANSISTRLRSRRDCSKAWVSASVRAASRASS